MLLIERIPDAHLQAFHDGLAALPLRHRLRWETATLIHSDDADVIAFLTALGLDPAVVLAPEA
jgi:hypothetical protein